GLFAPIFSADRREHSVRCRLYPGSEFRQATPLRRSRYDPAVDDQRLRDALLDVMERKVHWAWSAFTRGEVAADRLHLHFEQEFETYVRDFPVMVGWAYVQCPVAAVRRELAENLFEEETGGLVAGRPHPELFLEYPRGLGMDLTRFDDVQLLPAAENYRRFLDDALRRFGWDISAAIATIFIEGTSDERAALVPSDLVAPPALEE